MISRKPQNITKEVWYYEEKGHIELLHEIRVDGNYVRTDHIKIPKWRLKRSLKRMEEKP